MNNQPHILIKMTYENKTDDSQFELIKVKDKKKNKIHYLLIKYGSKFTELKSDGASQYLDCSLSITVYYAFGDNEKWIGHRVTNMGASIKGFHQTCKLTNGGVMVNVEELRGLHIGSYVFNKIVHWAKTHASGMRVEPITLSRIDASEDNKLRRNSFYEHFGLKFNYRSEDGIENAAGRSFDTITTDDLKTIDRFDGIISENPYHAFQSLAHHQHDTKFKLKENAKLIRSLRRETRKKERVVGKLKQKVNWLIFVIIAYGLYLLWKMTHGQG